MSRTKFNIPAGTGVGTVIAAVLTAVSVVFVLGITVGSLIAFLALNVIAGFGFSFWEIVGLGWVLAAASSNISTGT